MACFHHATIRVYTGDVLGKTYDSEVCSAARALELVGERWSLLIIRNALFAGATRYSDFRSLAIATNILKTRLDSFIESGIMERRGSMRNPEHYEYVLTDKGRDLATVVVALTEWGDRWLAPDGPPDAVHALGLRRSDQRAGHMRELWRGARASGDRRSSWARHAQPPDEPDPTCIMQADSRTLLASCH